METKINIAEILKDKPQGIKLYADAFGELSIEEICTEDELGITLLDKEGDELYFYNDGKYNTHGEPILVPSKLMRDWSKFAWKRGDVLVNKYNNSHIIFDKFNDDTYTTFTGKLFYQVVKAGYNYTHTCSDVMTQNFDIEKGDAVQTYINAIEERLGGKLNRETLEVEKTQPEFKDGDIVCISGMGYLAYSIVKSIDNSSKKLEYYVLNDMSTLKFEDWLSFEDKLIQPITETQQIILFDALAKQGKAWDAERKAIVDLKPKWNPKPFDRVITRNPDTPWTANFFSHIDSDGVKNCIDDKYLMCLPYNEETAKLIGTTDNWEG